MSTQPAPDPREAFVVRQPSTIFADAPDVERIAKRYIAAHHKHLSGARIRYQFRLADGWKSGGKDVAGKAAKLSAQQQFMSGDFDAVITIDANRWEELSPEQREALVDHELCHYVQAEDRDGIPVMQPNGRPVLKIRAHDVEEFVAVIQRHGLWDIDLVHAGKAIRQIPMDLEASEDEEADDERDAAQGVRDDVRIEIRGPNGEAATGTIGDLRRVADLAEHRAADALTREQILDLIERRIHAGGGSFVQTVKSLADDLNLKPERLYYLIRSFEAKGFLTTVSQGPAGMEVRLGRQASARSKSAAAEA